MITLRRYRPGGQIGPSRDFVTPGIHAPCLIHPLSELYDLEKPRHERPSVTHILHSIRVKSTSVSGGSDPCSHSTTMLHQLYIYLRHSQ